MPKTLNEWKEKIGNYSEKEMNIFDLAEGGFVNAISNAVNGSQIELNKKLTKASAAVSYLKFASVVDAKPETEEKLQSSLNDIVSLAEYLKDKKNMKAFAKTVNADKAAPLFGPDCNVLTSIFNMAYNNFGVDIDSKGFKNLYNECKNELIKEGEKELKEEQKKSEMIPIVKLLGSKHINTIKEENEFEEEVEKKASPEEMNIIIAEEEAQYNINNMSLDNDLNLDDIIKENEKQEKAKEEKEKQAEAVESQRTYAKDQAMSDNNKARKDLYAKHNNDGFFRIGGASKELRELRSAHSTYDTYMRYSNDPKVAKLSEFDLLKDILTKAEKYRAEKKLHGKGDTSSPNWKPKTRMGQLRYAAAAKSIEFAKNRMRTLVSDYANDKNITLKEAYEHFDPDGKLKLYIPNKKVNLDDKIKESQKNLRTLKENAEKGIDIADKDIRIAIGDLSAAYLIKATKKTGEVKPSDFEEKSDALFRSAAVTKIMDEYSREEIFDLALRDKGQDIWSKVNQARTEIKEQKKIKDNHKKSTEMNNTATATITNNKTIGNVTVPKPMS
ncbi:MAG: hypothetical protein IKR76_10440 [Ruminococcus sp.]|nr:hypothetical protein [Ruminococcus sp.]